jgi:hypothetical protein
MKIMRKPCVFSVFYGALNSSELSENKTTNFEVNHT